jgi:hypothetical protein
MSRFLSFLAIPVSVHKSLYKFIEKGLTLKIKRRKPLYLESDGIYEIKIIEMKHINKQNTYHQTYKQSKCFRFPN